MQYLCLYMHGAAGEPGFTAVWILNKHSNHTRDLGEYLELNRAMLWLTTECVMLLLQHGARINYGHMFLVLSPKRVRKQHNEEYIELLRAADPI